MVVESSPSEDGSEVAGFIRLGFNGSGIKGTGVSEPCPELIYDSPSAIVPLGILRIGVSGHSPRVMCSGGGTVRIGATCLSIIDCSTGVGAGSLASVF